MAVRSSSTAERSRPSNVHLDDRDARRQLRFLKCRSLAGRDASERRERLPPSCNLRAARLYEIQLIAVQIANAELSRLQELVEVINLIGIKPQTRIVRGRLSMHVQHDFC